MNSRVLKQFVFSITLRGIEQGVFQHVEAQLIPSAQYLSPCHFTCILVHCAVQKHPAFAQVPRTLGVATYLKATGFS